MNTFIKSNQNYSYVQYLDKFRFHHLLIFSSNRWKNILSLSSSPALVFEFEFTDAFNRPEVNGCHVIFCTEF